jgi:hypothetical protein
MSTSEQHTDQDRQLDDDPMLTRTDDGTAHGETTREERMRDSGGEFPPDDTRWSEPSGSTAGEPVVDEAPLDEPGLDESRRHDDVTLDDSQPVPASNGSATGSLRGDDTATSGAGAGSTDDRAPLVSPDRAEQFATRWNEVKGMFVDEPRQAVRHADALVGELLDDLENSFRTQRQGLENGLDNDDTSTEDLRVALRRYRSFFDRLLSV